MRKFKSRFLVALLTFGIGVLGVCMWMELVPTEILITEPIVQPTKESEQPVQSQIKLQEDLSLFKFKPQKPLKDVNPDGDGSLFQWETVSKYKHPAITDGLYFSNNDFTFALVLSFNNKPIPPKENDPDAPTIPGFYEYTDYQRFAFQRVEVIGKKVYFKTISIDGISYEFKGTTRKEFNPEYNAPISFIKGILIKKENENVVSQQKVEFGHALVC